MTEAGGVKRRSLWRRFTKWYAWGLSQILAVLKPGVVARVALANPDGTRRTVNVTLGELPAA